MVGQCESLRFDEAMTANLERRWEESREPLDPHK